MWAQHRIAAPDRQSLQSAKAPRVRRVHRTIAMIFTTTVGANFVAMPWGTPPWWITYAPLPPLFVLMASGLYILAARRFGCVGFDATASADAA